MHLTLRADGGPAIGYGHLVRTSAVARELRRRDHAVTLATTTPRYARDVYPPTVEVLELPDRSDPEPMVEWLETSRTDAVFTDAYPIDTSYQRRLRETASLAVLQDDARHVVCADLFVNGNLYAAEVDYEFVGNDPRICLGPEYVLLRREIRSLARTDPPWRDPPERAIVTMGGNDAAGVTPTILRGFDGFELRVDAIVGPGFSSQQEREIEATASAVSTEIDVIRDPGDLPERLFRADIGVSTASTTTYELLALGTPIVSVPVVSDQEQLANALRDRNLGTVLESPPDETAVSRAVEDYVTAPTRRRDRRTRGRELVDTNGVERVVDALLELDP